MISSEYSTSQRSGHKVCRTYINVIKKKKYNKNHSHSGSGVNSIQSRQEVNTVPVKGLAAKAFVSADLTNIYVIAQHKSLCAVAVLDTVSGPAA